MNNFLTRFNELGALNNLSFSIREIMQHAAIGLDAIHRKLLILKGSNEKTACNQLIELKDIKTSFLKKQYGIINAGSKHKKLEHFLETISLCLEQKGKETPVEIVFYDHTFGNNNQIKAMEEKAKYWEVIINTILKSHVKQAA